MNASTTSSTRKTLTQRVTALEGTLSDLATGQSRILALLEGDQPAKVTRKATTRKATTTRRPARKAAAKKVSPSKVPDCDKKGLTRKVFNASVSKLSRSMGQHESGVSVYRVVQNNWTTVVTLRDGEKKVTPRQAVAAALKA